MKRYQFELNGETIYKNVSLENEQMFFNKYGKYNPTLVSEEPGKSQGTSQSQNNQQENTESKSEDGSSESRVKYKIGDDVVKVPESDIEEFEKENPDAEVANFVKGSFLDKWTDEQDNIPKDKGFVADLILSTKQGKERGYSTDEAFAIYGKGATISPEEMDAFIEQVKIMSELPETEAQAHFNKLSEEHGGGIWGTIKAISPYHSGVKGSLKSTEGLLHLMVSSGFTIGASLLDSDEAQLAATTGFGVGVASGKTAKGRLAKGVGGAFVGVVGAMETSLTLTDLLKEELHAKGIDPNDFEKGFTAVNIRGILEDPEAIERIKKKSLARGLTIAAVEGLTLGLSRGVATQIGKKTMSKSAAGIGATVTEGLGGSLGEAGGQIATGGVAEPGGFDLQKGLENIDSREVFLEGLLETPGGVFSTDIVSRVKGREYKINGSNVTKDRVVSILKDTDLSASEKAKVLSNIEIKNDDTLQSFVDNSLRDVDIELNIDSRVSNINDRKSLVELEKKRIQAEIDAKKTGVFSVPDAQANLDNINSQIKEVLNTYEGKEGVTQIEQEAAEFNQRMAESEFKTNLEFAKKHSKIYGLEVDDTLTREQIREQFGDEAADADGWIDNETNMIYVNTEVAMQTRAVNVGNHELLHGILRKEMKKNPDSWIDIKDKLKETIGDQFSVVEQRAADNYTEQELIDSPDEWLTLTSDAIANGEITYSESAFQPLVDLFLPILRAAGFKQINFVDADGNVSGEAVFEFLKEYNRSIHKGSLSGGIVSATGGVTQVEGDKKFSKSNLDGLLKRFDGNTTRMINQTLAKRSDGQPVEYKEDRHGNYIAGIDSEFGQEIMPIVESITKRLFDPIPRNIADNAGVSRQSYQADLISEAAALVTNEYNGKQSLDKFVSNRLNLRAESLAKRLGIKSVEESSQETRIDRRYGGEDAQLQIEDTSQQDQAFELEDILQKQIQQQKGILEVKKKGDFVKTKLKFSNEVNDTINETLKTVNLDVDNRLYEDVKGDMMSQANPSEASKNRVKPTGSLYPVLETISEDVFGVNPKTVMAKPQNLTTGESTSARTKIAEDMQRLGPKEYIKSILTPFNFNPKSGKAIGINPALLKALYIDGELRMPNIKGKALNVDNMSDADILSVFGINPDFTLMPHERKFDGPIKGLITQVSVFAANQEARSIINKQSSQLGIGKSDIMFSKSQKRGFSMGARDLAKYWSEKSGIPVEKLLILINIDKNKHYKSTYDGIYDNDKKSKRYGETIQEAKDRITKEFLKEYPQFRQFLAKSGTGGLKRSTYGTLKEKDGNLGFNDKYPPYENEIELIRHEYLDKKKQQPGKVNLTKDQQAIENKKLDNLKDYFVAIQKFIEKNPEGAFLFISFYEDGGAAGMGSTVRVSFPYKIYTINQRTRKPNYDDNMREEHNHPANQIHSALLYAAMEGNVEQAFPGIRASVMQGAITLEADTITNKGEKNIYGKKLNLTSAAPDIWFDEILPRVMSGDLKIEDGMGAVARLAIQGVNLNELMLEGKDQTVAEFFGVGIDTKNLTDTQIEHLIPYQNDLIIKFLAGKTTKRKATNAINKISKTTLKKSDADIKAEMDKNKAEDNVRKYSKSGIKKGASIFDFDDTLAKTKSGVRGTVPNIDGEPKPKKKVIFLAGGAGSGKGNVVKKLGLEDMGFKIVNQDISLEWLKNNHGLPENMNDLNKEQRSLLGKLGHQARGIAKRKMMKFQGQGNGVVVDGTGASLKQMEKLVAEFEAKGYDVSMIFVDTSLPVALKRNKARKERSLLDIIVKRNHESVQNNKSPFKKLFGKRFMEVNTDNLTQESAMPIELVAQVEDFVVSYEKFRLDADEFAAQGDDILERGGEFDFSEFNEVIDGTPGPLLNKAKERAAKYGTKDIFVLTARPQASAKAIHKFLKDQGLDIPLKNITGLADSSATSKALWMVEKYAEGYNDLYFVDDAYQNVEAVQDVLSQLDVKSEVVQAKRKFSKSASQNFNTMLEESEGTSRDRTFSTAEAKRAGKNKGWWRIFVPPSAEDFKGMLYRFLGTGKRGELHMKWFKIKLLDPFAKAIRNWNTYKQRMVDEYKELRKNNEEIVGMLGSKVGKTGFSIEDAIRVYLWDKSGWSIPGLDNATKQELIDFVNDYTGIKAYADTLGKISRAKKGYVSPSENWAVQTIADDLNKTVNKIGRRAFLKEWLTNVEAIFTPENMNKIEALYGTGFREALENILYRMEYGTNRLVSNDKNVNKLLNWINGSIGAIMFINTRSALLQTMSTVNFINWTDNNIFKASAAFANQEQFWSDFAMLWNSPQLKQRRKGLQIDVSASELAKTFADGKGTPQGVINWLLEKGFLPTQIVDSFAIAFGGASLFRNRMNTYIKQGMSEVDAMNKAMLDFQEIAEETQQSSREDLISQQQASVLGRLVLAFQNVTMQYARQNKKALSDLMNGRGDVRTNISKILYYGMVQNVIFAALQSALFAVMWGDDEEEIDNRTNRVLNSALDSFLRGTGLYGAIVATVKNTIIQHQKQKEKKWGQRDDGKTILEIINFSPPIGSKLRKIWNAIKTEQYNEGVSEEIGWRIENPNLYKWASIIEAVTNIPAQRVVKKLNNLEEAITGNHLLWQRIFLGLGWSKWDLGVKDEELEAAKAEAKANRNERRKEQKTKDKKNEVKEMKDKGLQRVQCSGKNSKGSRCGLYSGYIKEKTWKCQHHVTFTDGMDRDGDGLKEHRCIGIKSNGKRCKNKTENKNKKCYAHQ